MTDDVLRQVMTANALRQAGYDIETVGDDIRTIAGALHAAARGDLAALDTSLAMLSAIADVRAALAIIAKDIEAQAIETMPYRHVVEGIGEYTRHSGTKRTEWDHDALTRKLVALALDERKIDPESGEVLESEAQCVARVLSECARPTWRLTPLRARKIPIDEYCTERDGNPTIELPKRG